jgi:CCR4-NOT transcription complex subunit 1 TTP binding domain
LTEVFLFLCQGISNISNLFPDITGPIAREVEDEANSYFQRIYNHPPHPTLTIDEVLALLKEFQVSFAPNLGGLSPGREIFIAT